MSFSRIQQFSIIFAFIMVTWSLLPLVQPYPIDTLTITSSCLLFLIGIAYPLVVFKPEWNKAAMLIEGLLFLIIGLLILTYPINLLFIILGIILIIIAILAYQGKLPKRKNK